MEKQRVVFLQGKKVILRPLRKETDLEIVVRWINDPEVRQFTSSDWPITANQEEEWFDRKKDNEIRLAIETLGGIFIGVMGLHNIDFKNRVAVTGALIGEKKYWGKGYGTDAKMILLYYAFMVLNLRKICSSALAYNKRSIEYNKKCGYKVEGTKKKQFYKKGKYWDEIQLAIFKKDFLKRWREYKKNADIKT